MLCAQLLSQKAAVMAHIENKKRLRGIGFPVTLAVVGLIALTIVIRSHQPHAKPPTAEQLAHQQCIHSAYDKYLKAKLLLQKQDHTVAMLMDGRRLQEQFCLESTQCRSIVPAEGYVQALMFDACLREEARDEYEFADEDK